MKWIYIILLVGLVGGALSSEKLRGYIFSSDGEQTTTEETGTASGTRERPTSSRLEEAEAITAIGSEVAR